MIELIQFPWSPFCIVQRRILEFSGTKFKIINVPNGDRSLVWRLSRHRYYAVPIIRDGKNVIFEVNEDSQVIAKYIDSKLQLGLFAWELEGVQSILWRYIESDIEGIGFKLNEIDSGSCVIRSESSGAAASTNGARTKNNCWRSSSKNWCLSKKCCCTKSSSWTAGRGLSISISMECSAIFCIPAITGCPRSTTI